MILITIVIYVNFKLEFYNVLNVSNFLIKTLIALLVLVDII